MPTVVVQNFRTLTYRNAGLQWTIAAAVGLMLGVYVIIFWLFPTKWATLSLLVVAAPFAAMIVGQVRKLLLAIVIIDIPLQMDTYLSFREGAIGGAIPGLGISVTTLVDGNYIKKAG